MTPVENYDGIYVKREDLYHPDYPNGKMRAFLPYMQAMKDRGISMVAMAAGSRSRSPAVASFVGKMLGIEVHIFSNTNDSIDNPTLKEAYRIGEPTIHYCGQCRYANLRHSAERWVANHHGAAMFPSDNPSLSLYKYYSEAMRELDCDYKLIHVIPFFSGSWLAGLWHGMFEHGRTKDTVVAVPADLGPASANMVAQLLQKVKPQPGYIYNELPDNLVISYKNIAATPWPSDRLYTHRAWSVAKSLAAEGRDNVLVWSMGLGWENMHLRQK